MGPLMGAAAVSAGEATPEEAGVDPDNVFRLGSDNTDEDNTTEDGEE